MCVCRIWIEFNPIVVCCYSVPSTLCIVRGDKNSQTLIVAVVTKNRILKLFHKRLIFNAENRHEKSIGLKVTQWILNSHRFTFMRIRLILSININLCLHFYKTWFGLKKIKLILKNVIFCTY